MGVDQMHCKNNSSTVFKTEPPDDNESEITRKPKSGSEPPPSKDIIERKTSSTGRFVVMTDNPNGVADSPAIGLRNGSQDDEATRENGIPSREVPVRSKGSATSSSRGTFEICICPRTIPFADEARKPNLGKGISKTTFGLWVSGTMTTSSIRRTDVSAHSLLEIAIA
ncbi:hypothetical protein ANCCAN_26648 [Ancylostoma caninum]|uniref:Uncharacterized protein n=1 Tax=Ancylostoma caninum TaxID=29170 RepID=A0A368F9S2_ANCCA|nr:hypothetical protein ANCCAN_26648 [Ancylostoma caninum]